MGTVKGSNDCVRDWGPPEDRGPKRLHLQLGQQEPRNPTEALFLERYGTVTPVPQRTLEQRKNSIVVCSILYIHQGIALKDACRMLGINYNNTRKVVQEDKWDEFAQELVQLVQPSNLSLIEAHDIGIINTEQRRRESDLQELVNTEKGLVSALKEADPASPEEARILTNMKRVRELIDDVTGLSKFKDEMSAARKAGLLALAKEATGASNTKQAKGNIIDL